MRSRISLPVIEELTIRNYSLYPGTENGELRIPFVDGVTVIAGINGIGKTTLLTLISRMLLGPTNPKKANRNIGRVSQREIFDIDKYDFFSNRVPEILGDDSTATLKFRLGEEDIVVTRYMRDMRLKSASFSGVPFVSSSEGAIIEELARKAGLLSGYDYHVVIRNLQFFNEDRPPLLWDAGSQFELYKILFFDEDTASRLNDNFAKIQSLDSERRNRTHLLNKRRDSLPTSSKSSALIEIETLTRMIEAAKQSYETANSDFLTKKQQLESLQARLRSLDIEAEDAQISLAELEQQLTRQDAMFILQALPTLGEKEKFLLQGFSTGCGCFICGSKSKEHIGFISSKTTSGHCFACNAPIATAETDKVTPIAAQSIKTTEFQIEKLLESIAHIDSQRVDAEQQIKEITPQLRTSTNERTARLLELDALNAQRPDAGIDPHSLLGEIEREENELILLGAEIKRLTAEYRSAIIDAESRLDEVKEDIRQRLNDYAIAFLQEEISISFKNDAKFSIATGAEKVLIPSFTIRMTSSTHAIPHEREDSNSVSESQKEFLDLAFRMSLLDIISRKGSTMLIVETPEASLDSWFMRRAAELMRAFAPDSGGFGRKLIATSNVNGTVMIPALLGLIGTDGSISKLPQEREKHLINLLKLTPTPATLREDKATQLLDEELGRYLHAW